MRNLVTLRQSDVQLANCRKLESSISNALQVFPVGHGKLNPQLGQLTESSSKPACSLSRPVWGFPPTHRCVPEPLREFDAYTCERTDGPASHQADALALPHFTINQQHGGQS